MLSTVTLNNKDISVSVLKIKLLKHGMHSAELTIRQTNLCLDKANHFDKKIHLLSIPSLCPMLCLLTHTQQQQQQPFYGPLSRTTWVSRYQKKHSPTHHPDHPIFISFFHLLQSTAS